MFEDIQRLDILAVLDKLGLEYINVGMGEYRIKGTDGWSINTDDNIITDFSNKGRPVGGPFPFVRDYLNINEKETFEWFKQKFNLQEEKKMKKKEIKCDVKKTWQELPLPSNKHIDYLKSRGIEYNKIEGIIKSFKGGIGALVYDTTGQIGLTARILEGNTRFTSLKGCSGNGVYLHKIDKTKKQVIVVEGLFDFLSLRQYFPNVVGLKSALSGLNIVEKLSEKYEIILIPDNDEQGKSVVNKLSDTIEFKIFDLSKYNVKDINELIVNGNMGEEIIDLIFEQAEEIEEDFSELEEKSPYTWGLDGIDNGFGKFYNGDFIVIVGESGHGKTEFSLFQAIQNSKNNKVCYLTLEMTPKNLLKRLAMKKAGITILEDNNKNIPDYKKEIYKKEIKKLKSNKNLKFITPENCSIDGIINTIKEYTELGYNLFYLDNFGFVVANKSSQSELEVMTELSRRLKQLTNELGITIIGLHHFNKGNEKSRIKARNLSDMRGSGKIENDIDYGFIIHRDTTDYDSEEVSKSVDVIIAKNRRNGIVGKIEIYFDEGVYKENLVDND